MGRRSRRAARAVAWFAGCASAAAFAAGDVRAAGCDAARVTFPPAGAVLAGRVGVFGSAEIDGFQFYKVEVARAAAPEAWTATSDVVRSPARHARLDHWATAALPDGRYRLKLTVVDTTAQERCRVVVDDLVVANGARASAAVASSSAAGSAPAWPTAVRRAVLQATAPLSDTAVVPGADSAAAAEPAGAGAATDAGSVGATAAMTASGAPSGTAATTSTTPASGSDATAADGAQPVDAAAAATSPASTAARFGRAFALGFVAVAAGLAFLARRARGRARARTETRARGR